MTLALAPGDAQGPCAGGAGEKPLVWRRPCLLAAMYLRPQRVLHLQSVMQLLAAGLPADDLRTQLARPLLGLLDADFYASYVLDEACGRFGGGVVFNVDPVHGQRYEQRFQFHDPLTPLLKARRVPTRVTDVLPQRELLATDFFNDFLRPEGLHWGVNAYVHDGERHLGDLRIWRRRAQNNFDADEVRLLQMIYPALIHAFGRGTPAASKKDLPARSELCALLVERAGLSRREAEVAVLVYEGLSDKDIARALQIGFTTVRTHLAAVFRKLDCDGRTQLAHRLARLLLA